MPTLTPLQREAYQAFTAMWEHYGMNRPTAHRILTDWWGSVPYFMNLTPDECQRIKFFLKPENLKQALASEGRATGICSVCNRELTDPESIAAGIGPICGGRIKAPTRLEELL